MAAVTNVVVVGGGIAGVSAALAAADAGARVILVRRGPGATALTGGGWISEPPAGLQDALVRAGHALAACSGPLPHPDGSLAAHAVAAVSHTRAYLTTDDALPALVCGIAGLGAFRPRALARLWSDAAGLSADGVAAATLTLDGTPAAGWSPASLARHIAGRPAHLGEAIARAVRAHGASRAIVPAVLGLDDHGSVLDAVTRAAGVPVGEALGHAPSLPGWRLDRALLRVLEAAGIELVAGRVIAQTSGDNAVTAVTVERDAGQSIIRADGFVLATGKFIGGGIRAESAFADTAFACDVGIERFTRTIDDAHAALLLTDPVRTEPQPLLGMGVRATETGLPLLASGDVAFNNVFVAGSLRAGTETAVLGLGAAAHDGWNAGSRAAAYAFRS
jgi:glycerol-3-phosphate dehydrogenase subunit B